MNIAHIASKIVQRPIAGLIPRKDNPRTHNAKQLKTVVDSIRRFGFTNPILIGADGTLVAGHARLEAARKLGMTSVPTITLGHLTPAELKAYVIADNRTAELAGWDRQLLALNLIEIEQLDPDFDLTLTGFDDFAIELLQDVGGTQQTPAERPCPEPDRRAPSVSKVGDLWIIGEHHRLICGDACERATYQQLLGKNRADLVVTDPPYNVPIQGHVSGLGKARHREFVAASGEMSREGFQRFMSAFMRELVRWSRSGSVHYIFMDWRHIADMLDAGEMHYAQLLNLVVWSKSNGGMGSFYRSQHELVAVFRNGRRAHINNVALGSNGRYRTNVWEYPGANSFGAGRDNDLAMHPTVKPIALVADAIRDASNINDIVLDPFSGSGTTLFAAHETKRRAYLVELDPLYVDLILTRAAGHGLTVRHAGTGQTFEDMATVRRGTVDAAAGAVAGAVAVAPLLAGNTDV